MRRSEYNNQYKIENKIFQITSNLPATTKELMAFQHPYSHRFSPSPLHSVPWTRRCQLKALIKFITAHMFSLWAPSQKDHPSMSRQPTQTQPASCFIPFNMGESVYHHTDCTPHNIQGGTLPLTHWPLGDINDILYKKFSY